MAAATDFKFAAEKIEVKLDKANLDIEARDYEAAIREVGECFRLLAEGKPDKGAAWQAVNTFIGLAAKVYGRPIVLREVK